MDKIKEAKHILDLYQDGYISEAGGDFFDLPIYKRERVVELRDKLAAQIRQLFEPRPDESNVFMIKGAEHTDERLPLYHPKVDESRLLMEAECQQRVEEIHDLLNVHIDYYMDEHGVKRGYGLAYKALSAFRQALKKSEGVQ